MDNIKYDKSNEHVPGNNSPDINKFNNNNERFSQWQNNSSLPSKIHELFDECDVISYLPLFERQGVDVAAFLTLTEEDMKNMGVEKLGPRKKIKRVIEKYRQFIKVHNTEVEPSQNETLERMNMQLQQAVAYIQKLQAHEQQYRSDFGKYVEAEQGRMSQIIFFMKDIGKNCKETSGQLGKIKDYHNRMEVTLNDLKNSPNAEKLLMDIRKEMKCEIEMASNRMDVTCQQIQSTLTIAQMNMPQDSHSQ